MVFTSQSEVDLAPTGDALDQALAIAWIASEIAVDVFGMLFWGALAMLVLRAVA